jgi:pimeloyl-ACP methyl ester carboxylesterase
MSARNHGTLALGAKLRAPTIGSMLQPAIARGSITVSRWRCPLAAASFRSACVLGALAVGLLPRTAQGCQGSIVPSALDGRWYGVATVRPDSGPSVAIRLTIRTTGDSIRAALSIPSSRLVDLEIPSPYSDSANASYRAGTLHVDYTPDIGLGILGRLSVPRDAERITFDGRLEGTELVGRLRITVFDSPIRLRRDAEPKARRELEVSFYSTQDSLRLTGKLVLPDGTGPFPAVIFVTGSDPDTREAWQVEARALAARGVASLLYDKRGVGGSRGASHDLASWDDLAGDAEGGLRYLRGRSDLVDPRRIGLIGQSQGTWIIAKVAARDPSVRFLVSISGSGISAAEQETYRTGALMAADGYSAMDVEAARAFQREKFRVARTGLGWERLDSTMQRLRRDSVKWFPGYGTGSAARSLALLRLYGVLQFNYDPGRDLERIAAPVLVLMGERDRVFPPALVIERMTAALRAGGNRRVTSRIIPGASHGMLSPQTVAGTPFRHAMNEAYLGALVDWVARQARAR